MKKNRNPPADAVELRRRAEERLKRPRPEGAGQRTEVETARLVHELQVHQVELEMQNEELQQARAQAETFLARYTDLYDFAPAGYLTLDRQGVIRQVNLTGARLLGIERSRLVNRRFGQLVAESDRGAFSDFLQSVFASQAQESCEVTLPQEGSQPLVVRIEGARSADGQECRAVVVDLAERKSAEEAMRRERQRLYDVLETLPVYVILLSADYHVPFTNRFFRERFGESKGRRCYEYLFHRDAPCEICETYTVLKTAAPHQWEWTGPDGRNYDIFDFPFTDEDGAALILEMGIDITERKRAAEALQQAHHELERHVAERTEKLTRTNVELRAEITERKRADALLRVEHDLALALSTTSRLKEGLRRCLEAALHISGMECGGFYLVDKTSGALDLAFHKGLSSDYVRAVAHYAADSANAKLVTAGKPVYTKHLALGVPLSEAERREGLRAIAVVPVSHEGQVIGCLNVASHALGEVPAFARDALETVVAQTGNAIARLQAEDALHHQTEVQQTIIDNIPVMITFLDREGRHQLVNRCWQSTLGWSLEETQHQDVLAEMYPDLACQKYVRDFIAVSVGTWCDFKTRTREGRVLDTSWVNVPLSDGSNIGIGIDITGHKKAEERIRMFSQEIIAAREEERKQVSAILHHDVGSLAVGLSAHLDAIEEDLRSGKLGEALKWLKRTRKLFDESVVRLKGLAVQLRPPELDVLGLRAALRQYFSQATKRGGTRIHFRETLGRRRVSGDTATILFRVAQEALTNAITHGHATRVDVGLSASKKEVRLTVRNNGKRFAPSEHWARATSRMGLRVMREMVVLAGGAFTIDSGRRKKTTVRVRLPLKTAALGPGDVTVWAETVTPGKMTRSAGRGSRPQKGKRA